MENFIKQERPENEISFNKDTNVFRVPEFLPTSISNAADTAKLVKMVILRGALLTDTFWKKWILLAAIQILDKGNVPELPIQEIMHLRNTDPKYSEISNCKCKQSNKDEKNILPTTNGDKLSSKLENINKDLPNGLVIKQEVVDDPNLISNHKNLIPNEIEIKQEPLDTEDHTLVASISHDILSKGIQVGSSPVPKCHVSTNTPKQLLAESCVQTINKLVCHASTQVDRVEMITCGLQARPFSTLNNSTQTLLLHMKDVAVQAEMPWKLTSITGFTSSCFRDYGYSRDDMGKDQFYGRPLIKKKSKLPPIEIPLEQTDPQFFKGLWIDPRRLVRKTPKSSTGFLTFIDDEMNYS